MEIIAYKPEHLDGLTPVEFFPLTTMPALAGHYAGFGPCLSLKHQGKVLAVGGVCLYWPGMGEGWLLVDRGASAWPVGLCRAVRRGYRQIERAANLRRLQITVRSAFEAGQRWARVLGFEHEGRLRGYGPDGEDYDLWARVN